jgi:hypothetical protein
MVQAAYATREQVKAALDIKETARSNSAVDRAIRSGARTIEGLTRRKFYPSIRTQYFEWPRGHGRTYRLWLDEHELISVATLVSGGVTISAADYFLEPNDGPPYDRIEIDRASTASFASNSGTNQRSIGITGTFGHSSELETVGTLSSQLDADVTDTATINWTLPQEVGVGSILKVDSEYVTVTQRSFQDTTQNLGTALTANNNNVTVAVSNGTAFYAGEIILIDAEKMLVTDVVGNNLIVQRPVDGSVLATHAQNADVYALTGMEVGRAQFGSTLALHLNGATIYRHVIPALINDLNVAEALTQLSQESAGYGRVVGSGENAREASGKGLADLRKQAVLEFGRRPRQRAV